MITVSCITGGKKKFVHATHSKIAAGVENLSMPFKMYKEREQYA
jgi:hypothetical protein